MEKQLLLIGQTQLPTLHGSFLVKAYRNTDSRHEPVALIAGSIDPNKPPLVRIHDACFTSEVFGSLKCDCNDQLVYALQTIQENSGIIIYLHQEGRGIGLANKIAAYGLQETGLDTVEANRQLHLPDDAREYEDAAEILKNLNCSKIRLLTNNPRKISHMETLGIEVVERVPIEVQSSVESQSYLQTKIERMGHLINRTNLKKK